MNKFLYFVVLFLALNVNLLGIDLHTNSRGSNVHTPYRWVFADSAARVNSTVTVSDTLKLALQKSDSTTWLLLSTTGVKWKKVSDGGRLTGTDIQVTDSIKGVTGTFTGNLVADTGTFTKQYFGTKPTNNYYWTIGLGKWASIYGYDVDETYCLHNAYYYSGWKYRESDVGAGANYLNNAGGIFTVKTAPDGVQDSTITWIDNIRAGTTGVSINKSTAATAPLDVKGLTKSDSIKVPIMQDSVTIRGALKLGSGSYLNTYIDTTFYDSLFDGTTYRERTLCKIIQVGNVVTLQQGMMFGTITASTYTYIKGIPSKFYPATVRCVPVSIINNANIEIGLFNINSGTFWLTNSAAQYLTAGSAGGIYNPSTITWLK